MLVIFMSVLKYKKKIKKLTDAENLFDLNRVCFFHLRNDSNAAKCGTPFENVIKSIYIMIFS